MKTRTAGAPRGSGFPGKSRPRPPDPVCFWLFEPPFSKGTCFFVNPRPFWGFTRTRRFGLAGFAFQGPKGRGEEAMRGTFELPSSARARRTRLSRVTRPRFEPGGKDQRSWERRSGEGICHSSSLKSTGGLGSCGEVGRQYPGEKGNLFDMGPGGRWVFFPVDEQHAKPSVLRHPIRT